MRATPMDAPTPSFSYDAAPLRTVEAQDAHFALRCFGDGPDLLLLHGFPVHGYIWNAVLPALAQRFRCWVVDLPGLGDSQWSDGADFGFNAQSERLGLLVAELGLTRAAVVAHDTGATLARLLALDRPAVVSKLALINTEIPGHRPPFIREFQLAARLPGARGMFRALLSLKAFRRSPMGFGGFFHDRARLDEGFDARFVAPLLADPRRIDGALRFLRGIDWDVLDALAQRHRAIRARVQLIWGEDDPTFPVQYAEELRLQFDPPCTLHRIAQARLLPHVERPAQVLDVLLPFLAA